MPGEWASRRDHTRCFSDGTWSIIGNPESRSIRNTLFVHGRWRIDGDKLRRSYPNGDSIDYRIRYLNEQEIAFTDGETEFREYRVVD